MGKILFKAIVGLIAGLLAWVLVEPFKPDFRDQLRWGMFEVTLMATLGLFVGGTVGAMSGFTRGSKTHMLREALLGALFGCIGIGIGRGLTAPVLTAFPNWQNGPQVILVRTIFLALIGGGLGLGIGFSTFVTKRGIQGFLGGLIGGAIAGFLFDMVGGLLSTITLFSQGIGPGTTGEIGGPSRAIMCVLLGTGIALFIGIIEALSRSAWIRLELGRNEGKEWVLDKPTMTIGRFEKADIPLFGDQNIAPQHAVIQRQDGHYFITDMGSPMGIGVNGQRVSQAALTNGSYIQIGQLNLVFQMRDSAIPRKAPEPLRGAIYPGANIGGQVIPNQPMPVQPNPVQPTFDPTVMQPAYGQPTFAQPAPTSASLCITALDGPLMGQKFPLQTFLELGRESQQVPLAFDTGVSRRHARVEVAGLSVNLADLGSTNGTFINGQRVTSTILRPGDIFKVGVTSFRLENQ